MYILGTYVSYDFVMIALIAVFLLSLYASGKVQRTFKKYSDQPGSRGVTAGQAAREMLHAHNSGVQVTEVSGSLTDHFDPTHRLVGLSNAVYGSSSISALAVAAHEIGHVLQYEEGYSLMTLRSKILPAAQLGSNAGPIIAIVGLMIQSNFIASLGLYLYAAMFLFQLITLPVEINASKRGLDLLQEGSYIPREKEYAAKAVLRAAAMTYVWAAIASLLSLLRLAILVKGNRRRD